MRKLGRTTAQRKAMLRGMVTLLLENGKIETTYTRAQEPAPVFKEAGFHDINAFYASLNEVHGLPRKLS